ncbi:DDE superfamily endonuclease [Phytophthora infestans]|uniref:DDE superfamily endonuclease n=1 Tax=Phytophthora infestans TaxID=4787 RepID=A0A8S9U426_PHYIN|nr:DDE superfamily endonuclease [Phytophthora infestans]KAF4134993.1 DDE superfamily endonuclease [Phytophthora infestans]
MQLDVKLTEQVVLATALLAIDMDIGEVLYHLARFHHDDLVAEFGRSHEAISSTASTIASMIYDKIKYKMALDHRMVERLTQRLVDAIFTKSYPLRSWLIVPYAGAVLTNAQTQFNFDLSKARIAVEWRFGWIVSYWKYFTLPNNMKVPKSPVGLLYIVAAFLTGVRRRIQSSKYFRCSLPTLQCYLAELSHHVVDEADYPSDEEADVFGEESDMSSDSDSDSNYSEDSVIESGDDSKFDD